MHLVCLRIVWRLIIYRLDMGLVTQFLYDYMHPVCLCVVCCLIIYRLDMGLVTSYTSRVIADFVTGRPTSLSISLGIVFVPLGSETCFQQFLPSTGVMISNNSPPIWQALPLSKPYDGDEMSPVA